MHNRSLSRELSLLSIGLITDKGDLQLNKFQIEEIFESALDSLINHFIVNFSKDDIKTSHANFWKRIIKCADRLIS